MPIEATEPVVIPAAEERQFPHWRFTRIEIVYSEHPVVNARIEAQRCRYDGQGGCEDAPEPPTVIYADDLFALSEQREDLATAITALNTAIESYGRELSLL